MGCAGLMPVADAGVVPLLSVVMPSFNQATFIEEAVRSVLGQSYPAVELVVADGGSTDGTVELLAALAFEYPGRLRWCSEPDRGPAQAINKALKRVRGSLIGWLNSDDVYRPDAVQRAVEALNARPDWLMVYGAAEHMDEAGRVLDVYPTLPPPVAIESFQFGCFICQPSVFFRRSLYVLLGDLDESLQTAFDFDYWLRAFRHFPDRIGFVSAVQARSRLHAGCITRSMRRTIMLEGMQLLHRHLGYAGGHWLLNYLEERLSPNTGPADVEELAADLPCLLATVKPWVREFEWGRLEREASARLASTGFPGHD